MNQIKGHIAKSRDGHYTATAHSPVGRVTQEKLPTLEAARMALEECKRDLRAKHIARFVA